MEDWKERPLQRKTEKNLFPKVLGKTVFLYERPHGIVMRKVVNGRQKKAPGCKIRSYNVLVLIIVDLFHSNVEGTGVPT